MENERRPSYVAYEYKEIEARGERAALLMDCYQSLGWEAEKETAPGRIMLRRNSKIMNKVELTRLQRNMEACVAEIDTLQKSKTSKASITSLVIGLLEQHLWRVPSLRSRQHRLLSGCASCWLFQLLHCGRWLPFYIQEWLPNGQRRSMS